MKKVRIKTVDALAAVRTNKEVHIEAHKEAIAGYREDVIAEAEKNLALAHEGKDVTCYSELRKPASHEDDYDNAINMLDWSVDKEVELDQREFSQLIMDNWDWKGDFLRSQVLYNKK